MCPKIADINYGIEKLKEKIDITYSYLELNSPRPVVFITRTTKNASG